MKHLRTFIAILLCLLVPVGCHSNGGTAPLAPAAPATAPSAEGSTQPSVQDPLVGVYCRSDSAPDEDGHVIRIYSVGGVLLVQHCLYEHDSTSGEDVIYNSWIDEIWPEAPSTLKENTPYAHGVRQAFWPDNLERGYEDRSMYLTITASEQGVRLTDSFLSHGDEQECGYQDFTRAEDEGWFHTSLAEMQKHLPTDTRPDNLCGNWYSETENGAILLDLCADGQMYYAYKRCDLPLLLYVGVWSAEDDGTVWFVSDNIGDDLGFIPSAMQADVSSELLTLAHRESECLLPDAADSSFVFSKVASTQDFPRALLGSIDSPTELLHYEESFFDAGSGEDIACSYSLYRLHDDVPGADALNAAIDASMGCLIREQLDAIAAGDFPLYCSVWCECHEYKGLYSFVFALKDYFSAVTEYEVFYFDADNGSVLDVTDYLARMGIDLFTDFLPAAVQAGQDHLYENNRDLPAEYLSVLDDALTRTKQYVGLYDTDAFVTSDATVYAIVPVASMAGPAYMYQQLPLTLTPVESFG